MDSALGREGGREGRVGVVVALPVEGRKEGGRDGWMEGGREGFECFSVCDCRASV